MEHPAIFLDSRGSNQEDLKLRGLFVLALSEIGVCYFWHGNRIEDLPNARPTKISPEIESFSSKGNNRAIFAAKLDSIVRSSVASVRVAHGSLIKPSFEKLTAEHGVDISLNTSKDGVLFRVGQSHISSKGKVVNAKVYTLDSANAEDAILPIAKLHVNEKKRKNCTTYPALDFEKSKFDVDTRKRKSSFSPNEVSMQIAEVDEPICIEDRLRVAGLLEDKDKLGREDFSNGFDDAIMYDSLDFIVDVNLPRKKIRSQISKMTAGDACKMLELLFPSLRTGSASSKHLLPWIYYILVIHGQFIISHDSCSEMLDNLEKVTRLKSAAIHPLLKLSGRLQLIMTQIDKAGTGLTELPSVEKFDINEDEESDEDDGGDVDEMLYDDDDDDDESGSDD